MTTLQTLIIAISFGFLSCNYNSTENTSVSENIKADTITVDTTSKPKHQNALSVLDTIQKFIVDDYPVSNQMLADRISNNSSYEKQSGQTYSYDKVWFSNDSLNQTIVFELYTDYHRMVTYHFYTNDVPPDLINRMVLHIDGGKLATQKQKLNDFSGFLKQTTKINSSYFITDKGFKLGDSKQKAIDIYGKSEKSSMNNGIEQLEWEFIGDKFYNSKSDLKGGPIANDSFGHQIVMYFKNGKLIGQILYNDIP